MNGTMETWKVAILGKFGKKAKHRWLTAALDFQLVDKGIKPACLFDHWAVPCEIMQNFVSDVYKQGLVENQLLILCIGEDIVICNRKSFIKDSFHSCFSVKYVDISSSLPSPVICESHDLPPVSLVYEDLIHQIRTDTDCEDSITHSRYEVPVNSSVHVPCLFGLLLGYPCVYWYDNSHGEDNCLSGRSLHLFQIKGKILSSKTEGNCPSQDKLHGHVILSFTVPEDLMKQLQFHVAEWFVRWKDSRQWSVLFSSMWMEECVTNPQVVCL